MRFTTEYHEELILAGGVSVSLRLIRADDTARIVQIHAGLSPRSRTMRYFSSRAGPATLPVGKGTNSDDRDACGILALRGDTAVALARFVRLAPGEPVAEPALEVIDDLQARGLGTMLLSRLASAAHERGIRRFEADILPENHVMLQWIRKLAQSVPIVGKASAGNITVLVDISASATS